MSMNDSSNKDAAPPADPIAANSAAAGPGGLAASAGGGLQQQKKVCFICGSYTTQTINIFEPRNGPNIIELINEKFKVPPQSEDKFLCYSCNNWLINWHSTQADKGNDAADAADADSDPASASAADQSAGSSNAANNSSSSSSSTCNFRTHRTMLIPFPPKPADRDPYFAHCQHTQELRARLKHLIYKRPQSVPMISGVQIEKIVDTTTVSVQPIQRSPTVTDSLPPPPPPYPALLPQLLAPATSRDCPADTPSKPAALLPGKPTKHLVPRYICNPRQLRRILNTRRVQYCSQQMARLTRRRLRRQYHLIVAESQAPQLAAAQPEAVELIDRTVQRLRLLGTTIVREEDDSLVVPWSELTDEVTVECETTNCVATAPAVQANGGAGAVSPTPSEQCAQSLLDLQRSAPLLYSSLMSDVDQERRKQQQQQQEEQQSPAVADNRRETRAMRRNALKYRKRPSPSRFDERIEDEHGDRDRDHQQQQYSARNHRDRREIRAAATAATEASTSSSSNSSSSAATTDEDSNGYYERNAQNEIILAFNRTLTEVFPVADRCWSSSSSSVHVLGDDDNDVDITIITAGRNLAPFAGHQRPTAADGRQVIDDVYSKIPKSLSITLIA